MFALSAGVTLVALGSLFALGAGVTLVALGSLFALSAGVTLVALGSLFALSAGCTGVTFIAFRTLFTLSAGVTLFAFIPLEIRVALQGIFIQGYQDAFVSFCAHFFCFQAIAKIKLQIANRHVLCNLGTACIHTTGNFTSVIDVNGQIHHIIRSSINSESCYFSASIFNCPNNRACIKCLRIFSNCNSYCCILTILTTAFS